MTKTFQLLQTLTGHWAKANFHSYFKYFFNIIWAPYYWFSTKILILKHIFYFLKSLKGEPLTKFFCNSCKLQQATVPKSGLHSNFKYFFPYYLSSLLLIQHKKSILKHIFYFQKSLKRGPLTKTFPTPANFYGLLYQSQDFIRTLNIFFHIIWAPYYWFSTKLLILKHIFYFLKSVKGGYLNYLLLIQHKNFNFKHIFYFLKSVKGGPLTKTFQLLQTLTGHCAKARISFEL